MKKIVSLMMTAALCLGFAACGATASAASGQTAAAQEEASTEITAELVLSDRTGSVIVTEAGTYRVTGSLSDGQIVVNAPDAQVTLLLDGVDITADGTAAIYVAEADKVKLELAEGSENTLRSTGEYADENDPDIDAAVFSRDDLTIKGTGALTVESETGHAVVSKDDLKVTGGTLTLTAAKKGLSANDSVEISGGDITIKAGSDGVRADGIVTVNGGTLDINASEGIEATRVEINGGDTTIYATDDGVNATRKSTDYDVSIEINGGKLSITMAEGDTDALDANGSLIINGGTVDISARFAFDFDTVGQLNGGTVTVNGQRVTSITNSMMGGGMGGFGGMGGQPGGGFPSGGQGGFGGHGGGRPGMQ